MKRCPECGCTKFRVNAHIVQEWLVDGDGELIEVISECVGVAHEPDDEDVWVCPECGFMDVGYEFNAD